MHTCVYESRYMYCICVCVCAYSVVLMCQCSTYACTQECMCGSVHGVPSHTHTYTCPVDGLHINALLTSVHVCLQVNASTNDSLGWSIVYTGMCVCMCVCVCVDLYHLPHTQLSLASPAPTHSPSAVRGHISCVLRLALHRQGQPQ